MVIYTRYPIAIVFLAIIVFSGCEFLIDEELEAAVKKGTLSACDQLDTSENKERIDKCYQRIAENKGDASICPNIKSGYYQGFCYENVAVKTNNAEL